MISTPTGMQNFVSVLAALTLLSCAHASPSASTDAIAPKWVTDGTGVYDSREHFEFRAVGVAENLTGLEAVAAAEEDAAKEMIRLVSSHIDAIMELAPMKSAADPMWRRFAQATRGEVVFTRATHSRRSSRPKVRRPERKCPEMPKLASASAPWSYVAYWQDGDGKTFALAVLDPDPLARAAVVDSSVRNDASGYLYRAWQRQRGKEQLEAHSLKPIPPPFTGERIWIGRGSHVTVNHSLGPVFLGHGSVEGIKNPKLARTTAANRARAEAAKLFEVFSTTLLKAYMAGTSAGNMEPADTDMHVEGHVTRYCPMTLQGVRIVDQWWDDEGTAYAIAALPLDLVVQQSMHLDVSAHVKDFVVKNAERVFGEMLAEQQNKAL